MNANEGNAASAWVQSQFRDTPWTAWIVAINLVTWFSQFFQYPQLANLVAGELGVSTAWRWLTYPLFTPASIGFFLIGMFVFHWICASLERQWGSEKFLRVFVAVTLLTAATHWLAMAIYTQDPSVSVVLAGCQLPMSTLFVIWAAMNAEASILLFFVIPMKAKYLAWGSIAITVLAGGIPLGIGQALLPITAWFWAKKDSARLHGGSRPGKSIGQRLQERKREKKKSRFKVLEGKKLDSPGTKMPETKIPNLRELNREKEAKEKSANEAELDRILDKIRFEGMGALTAEEKATLDKQSQRLNDEG